MGKTRSGALWGIAGVTCVAALACSKPVRSPEPPAKTEAAPAAPAPAAPSADFCAGRSATTVEWFGMGYMRRVLGCRDGKPAVTIEWVDAHGESAPARVVDLDEATWNRLWAELDATPWRTLPADCPPLGEDAESSNTGVDYEITDGSVTTKVSCNGEMSAAHVDVYDAVHAATEPYEERDEESSDE